MGLIGVLGDVLASRNLSELLKPPSSSPEYRLTDILNAVKGRVPKELSRTFNDNALPYINIKAFEQGVIDHYVVSGDGVPVSENDLVIVWDGARCGLVGQGRNGILGSTLKKLSLKGEFNHVPFSYVRYFLQSRYKLLNGYSRGSVIQHVDPSLFRSLKIPIPDRDNERFQRICTLLNAVEDVEQHTAKQLTLVRQMRESVLHL